MSAAFTSGPWAVHPMRAYIVPQDHVERPIGGAEDAAYDLAHYAQEICALHHPDPHRGESEVRANANLIAAAPDLYAALERIRKLALSGEGPTFDLILSAADAALAKARGEQSL